MSYSFEYIDIILLAMIAGFIFLRLRGILGRKSGFEDEVQSNYEDKFPQETVKNTLKQSKFDEVAKKNFLIGAKIAYESIIFNEQNQFERASSLYDDNSIAFGYMVDSLEDSDARINRFNSAQKKVSKIWQGRSKRDAYSSIKKCVMSEPDLRQGDSGRWHDEL